MGATVQLGFDGLHDAQQMDMLGEFQGKDGRKEKLIDVDALKAKEKAKPLLGQVPLKEV